MMDITSIENTSKALVNEILVAGYLTRIPVLSPTKNPQNSMDSYRSSETVAGTNPISAFWIICENQISII
jgi:hypothetical protein